MFIPASARVSASRCFAASVANKRVRDKRSWKKKRRTQKLCALIKVLFCCFVFRLHTDDILSHVVTIPVYQPAELKVAVGILHQKDADFKHYMASVSRMGSHLNSVGSVGSAGHMRGARLCEGGSSSECVQFVLLLVHGLIVGHVIADLAFSSSIFLCKISRCAELGPIQMRRRCFFFWNEFALMPASHMLFAPRTLPSLCILLHEVLMTSGRSFWNTPAHQKT